MKWSRCCASLALVFAVACGGSKGANQPNQTPASAPYVGFSNTPGPTAELVGTTGALSGKEYWLSTSSRELPRVGAFGEVSWTLDRQHGPFGKGVIMGLGEVRVKQVQAGAPGMTQQILLEIMRGHGGISFNGVDVNVVTAGKQVKLTYKQ